jgi:hypothetical protein
MPLPWQLAVHLCHTVYIRCWYHTYTLACLPSHLPPTLGSVSLTHDEALATAPAGQVMDEPAWLDLRGAP